ncbi:MAG: Hsp20/alpha crystallin family protein [Microscillaceae bacterium]|jgi:HSP20 family protein|nr:Hsp20/alpha crystallin family protein [Microscillaceae bacterium]
MENSGNDKRKSFFDVIDEFLNKDFRDLGKEMRDFGKEFKKEFHNKNWGHDWVKTYPLLNVIEAADGYRLELAAPGLQKENFKVSIKDNELKIWAEVESSLAEGENYRKREFNFNKFQRAYTLPDDVNSEAIGAKYENGILIVTLPKKVQAQDEAGIEIKID